MAIRFSVNKVLVVLGALAAQVAFAQAVWDGTADTTWYTSNKSATEFTITTAEQLAGLARLVNGEGGNGTYNMAGKTIRLGANIMLNDTANWKDWENSSPANEWRSIGKNISRFSGTFDGSDYVISGMYVNSDSYVGLFGVVGAEFYSEFYIGKPIENIGITAFYVKGNIAVGGLVGELKNGGEIINGYSFGMVIGKENVGGLVGSNDRGDIVRSYSASTVIGQYRVGGLVGLNNRGVIGNTYSTGTVIGTESVGGLVGKNGLDSYYPAVEHIIEYSYSIGKITGEVDVGGFVGINHGIIESCYYDMETSGHVYVGNRNGSGKTTAEMKQQSTFVDWFFTGTHELVSYWSWGIDSKINCGYPYLLGIEYNEDEECAVVAPIRLPQIVSSQIIVKATSEDIVLENLPRIAKVEVYNLQGKRIYLGNPENPKILKIMIQARGIYIVKVGTQTFRVAVGRK